jgi:hypothetical protein
LPSQEFIRLIDSMPIMMAKAQRSGGAKVAREIAAKGYNSTKKLIITVSNSIFSQSEGMAVFLCLIISASQPQTKPTSVYSRRSPTICTILLFMRTRLILLKH